MKQERSCKKKRRCKYCEHAIWASKMYCWFCNLHNSDVFNFEALLCNDYKERKNARYPFT